ncbi:hypothetical protein GALMADRAFT_140366 [Galerina marginata CBS 339.88]|uniref:DUF6533 domain-containing protein n=1 Tax=Galerina marginata (strain CBS 339.88) TaxID=685588 RepID=A0A067T0A2_GALM3|nr:hypothetical protein GALMADRAFT_140366 [Galerina marginata CBS 339.88]
MELARGAAFSGIMLNACELFMNFPEEVECIWMTIGDFTFMKALYIFARYFIFVVHIQNFYYSQRYQNLDRSKPPPPGLGTWVLYKVFVWQTLIGVIDLVLVKRVYLLHNRKRWMFMFLSTILLCRMALIAITLTLAFKGLKVRASAGRDGLPSAIMINYTSGEMLLQCVLVSLAINRGRRSGRGRTPVVSRLAEGGMESSVVVLIMMITNLFYALGNTFSVFIYPCCSAIISALACRLILSLQRACIRRPTDISEEDNESENEETNGES